MLKKIKDIKFKCFTRDLLKYYGLNVSSLQRLNMLFGLPLFNNITEISYEQAALFDKFIQSSFILGDPLKKIILDNIEKQHNLKTFYSFRHKFRLPVRGQRSKQNARTIKRMVLPIVDTEASKDNYILTNKLTNNAEQ